MKKIFYFILLFFFIISITEAKNCVVVSGSGKNLGDEIACGNEHFYIIGFEGNKVKMLSKYNLLAGDSYYKYNAKDIIVDHIDDIYNINEVQQLLLRGYYIDYTDYTENVESGKYTIHEIYLKNETDCDDVAIFFSTPKEDYMDVLKSDEVIKKLKDGYGLYEVICNSSGCIGATFYLYDNYETAYVELDGSNITDEELLKNKSVKALLDKGYYVYDAFYNSSESNKSTYYLVQLRKFIYSDSKTIMFDKANLSMNDIINKKEVKDLLNNGYVINETFYDEVNCVSGICKQDYYAVQLVKADLATIKTIMFDAPVSQADLSNYLYDLPEYQELYNSDSYYRSNTIYDEQADGTKIYYGVSVVLYNDGFYESYLSDKYLQHSSAIGAHGDTKGQPDLEEIGIVNNDDILLSYEVDCPVYFSYFVDGHLYKYDMLDGYYRSSYYLDSYRNALKKQGYSILDVNLITVAEINDFVKGVTGKDLPLEKWYTDLWNTKTDNYGDEYYVLGNLKDFVPTQYSWLWGTTYWTRTISSNNQNIKALEENDYNEYMLFVDTLGDLCADNYCSDVIGAGLRPVVTVDKNNISYKIDVKTDDNGTVKVVNEAQEGDGIVFEIIPKEGYKLGIVKITDSNGKVITYTENKFTMPDAHVLIEVTFVVESPETSAANLLFAIILIIISLYIGLDFNKKKKWLNS